MRKVIALLIVISAILTIGWILPAHALVFHTADLAGTWHLHQIVSGDAPTDDPRWGYGSASINAAGNLTYTFTSPSATESGSGTIQINTKGVVKLDNSAKTNGAMNVDKNQIVLIDDRSPTKGHGFMVFTKRTNVSFTKSDLAGNWHMHQIVSGDAPTEDPRCGHGTASINTVGNLDYTFTNVGSGSTESGSATLQISSSGVVTLNNDNATHGVMNDAKDQVVMIDATTGTKGNGLLILTKRVAAANFSAADLAGYWYAHQVVSGDAPTDDPRWGYGAIHINATGKVTYKMTSPTSTGETGQATIQIDSGGIVTIDNASRTHGVVNDAQNQVVIVDGTSASKGYGLLILTRTEKVSIISILGLLLSEG